MGQKLFGFIRTSCSMAMSRSLMKAPRFSSFVSVCIINWLYAGGRKEGGREGRSVKEDT